MSLLYKRLPAATALVVLGLAACTDTTSFDGNFDAAQTSASVQSVQGTFDTEAFQSLSVLGTEFTLGGGIPAASAALVGTMGVRDARMLTERANLAARALAYTMAPAAILIPDTYRGLTYVYVPGQGYVADDAIPGAPANGVRFKLYAINPVTGEIADPLNEIGHADLIDLSDATTAAVQLVVVSGGVTYLDYTVGTTGPITAPTFSIAGYITDGVNLADFDMSIALQATFAGSQLDLDYEISIDGFSLVANIHFESAGAGDETATVSVSFTNGEHTVDVTGNVENDVGTLEVRHDGDLLALITITATGVTVTDGDGAPLTQDEIRALRDVVELVEDVFDAWEELFHPVEFLFGGP